ncbi:MAG: hypothetical protein KGL39_48365 [Patescibacteria group bacterium]|nr:hypothetical protein [Patescibacteria group bacterium]
MMRAAHTIGSLYTDRLKSASQRFAAGMNAGAPDAGEWYELMAAAAAFAEAAGLPTARRLHESSAATLYQELLGHPAPSREPLDAILRWFEAHTEPVDKPKIPQGEILGRYGEHAVK